VKDPPGNRLLPQNDLGEDSPPHVSFSSTPRSYVVDSSNGGLDAPIVLMNQPRPAFLRHPAKGNALPKAGVPSTARNLWG